MAEVRTLAAVRARYSVPGAPEKGSHREGGFPGYVDHEAAEWHPYRERWYFFPRKVSTECFDAASEDREKGNNLLAEEEKLGDFKCEGIEIV